MSKNIRSIIVGVIIILLAVVIAILINKLNLLNPQKNYAAVYLSTGEIYFGELSSFPRMKLSNIHLIQQDKESGQLSVQKFVDAVWKPKEPMYLNDEQVVFWTKIELSSPIVQAMEGKLSQTPQESTAPTAPVTTPPATPKK